MKHDQTIHSLGTGKPRWVRRRVWRWLAKRYWRQGWRYSNEPAGALTRVMIWDIVGQAEY